MLSGLGMEEPRAINDEELRDEIAGSEQRSLWLSCLVLSSNAINSEKSEIFSMAQQYSHPYNLLVKKIAADFVESCLGSMDLDTAERVLKGDSLELDKNHFFSLDREKYKNNTLDLSQEQRALVTSILNEINSDEDGFDQSPPIVPEVLKIKERSVGMYLAGAGLTISCMWVVWKIFSRNDRERVKVE